MTCRSDCLKSISTSDSGAEQGDSLYGALGEDAPLWDVDVGEGNDLSDLTQSVSLVLGSLGEGRP